MNLEKLSLEELGDYILKIRPEVVSIEFITEDDLEAMRSKENSEQKEIFKASEFSEVEL